MTSPKQERFKVPLAIAAVVVALLISAVGWYLWYQNQLQECQDLASQRRDDRAMWEFLLESTPDTTDNDVRRQAFVVQLDDRLPRQTCQGTSLVTIPPGE